MLQNTLKHIKTVFIHKYYVFVYCYKMNIIMTGLLHDWSKFSPVEFIESVKYYTGKKSPLSNARKQNGYSRAWMNHVHKNPHHMEHYLDINSKYEIIPIQMPNKRIKEMIADRIAACRTYDPETWNYTKPLEYFMKNEHENIMHPETREKLVYCLTLLSEKDEKAFKEIKEYLK